MVLAGPESAVPESCLGLTPFSGCECSEGVRVLLHTSDRNNFSPEGLKTGARNKVVGREHHADANGKDQTQAEDLF